MTPQRKRALIIAGIIGGVLLIGYIFLKGRSGATTAGVVNPSGTPAVPSADTSGGAGGASAGPSADESGLLSALEGQNQDLLNALLNSPYTYGQGLLLGSGSGFPTVGQTQTAPTPVSTPAPAPAPSLASSLFTAPAAALAATYSYPSSTQLGPVAYSPTAPDTQAAGASQTISGPIQTASVSDISSYFASTATAPVTSPTYGITYGAPAGQRATKKPGQGVITVH